MKTLSAVNRSSKSITNKGDYYVYKQLERSSKSQYLQRASNYQQLLRQSRSPLKNHRLFLRKRNVAGFLKPPVFYLEQVLPYGSQCTTG